MKPQQIRSNLRSKLRWGVFGIFALLAVTVFYDVPNVFNRGVDAINNTVQLGLPHIPAKSFALGLDLQGGAHLTYKADVKNIATTERGAAVEGVRDVIERRVNGLGVGEPNVQTSKINDDFRILVELPGVKDVNTAIKMIGETPILEFKEENNEPPRELTTEEQKQLDTHNAEAKKKADALLKRVQKNEDFAKLAQENSDDTTTKNNGGYIGYVGPKAGLKELYDWAKTVKPTSTSKTLITSGDGYNIVKRGSERDAEEDVEASHILICYVGAPKCPESVTYTKDEALAKANEVYGEANATNFADLAKQHSSDAGSKDKGGELGAFSRSAMVKPFADAVYSADVGQIIGPVETDFGFHIIYKTKKVPVKEYELTRILVATKSEKDILPVPDIWKSTGLSGKQLEHAEVATDSTTREVQVLLRFDDEGKELLQGISKRNLKKPLAIFVDGKSIIDTTEDGKINENDLYAPIIQSELTDGSAIISGSLTLKEAQLLSQRLNSGALPVPVELISQQTVGATLGADSLQKSLVAGLFAILLVMFFMVLYYRLPGIIAVIGLLIYASLSAAIFKLMGVTLSLSGIAGFILSVGMAVDANILVFERMKEELRSGRSLKGAVEEGFVRAWSSIRDGNSSVFIVCAVLMWFGTSFVKGFAITLAIGTLVSVFSAITVTRTLLRFVVPWFKEKGNWMFLGFKKTE